MVRRMLALLVVGTFVAGAVAPAFAQATAPAPAPAPAAPAPAAKPANPCAAKPAAKTDAAKMAKSKSATGAVKSATPESLVLVTKDKDKKDKEVTFVLDKDTKIMKAGKAVDSKELTDKDTATVSYTEADGKMMAKTVTVKAAAKAASKKPSS